MRSGVEELQRLNELRQSGKMQWSEHAHAWAAEPRDVVEALAHARFAEYKLAVTRSRRDRPPTGGVWQGLNLQTGAVASAIWVQRASDAESIVFIDIDGAAPRRLVFRIVSQVNICHGILREESMANRVRPIASARRIGVNWSACSERPRRRPAQSAGAGGAADGQGLPAWRSPSGPATPWCR